MKALAWKELREILGINVIALACYVALVANAMGARVFDWVPGMPAGTQEVPFTGNGFSFFCTFISVVFAAALGFRQSAWESARGTFLFLLHRPLRRETIFLVKLATGTGALFICASLPIVVYGAWAAVPGHHAGPFEWSMTTPAWRMTYLLPLLYFGAFLSGLRPARWFGTRLLPLIASILMLTLLSWVPWSVGFSLAPLLYVLLAANICFVGQRRDYA
jgi:ABC-type transport system involved in multi-copper enzyme maturation permease subunit